MGEKKLNIVFVECLNNYPKVFSANNSKMRLIAEGLLAQGAKVTFINSIFCSDEKNSYTAGKDLVNGIEVYSFPYSGKNLFRLIRNMIEQFRILKSLHRIGSRNIVLMGGPVMPLFILICWISKLYGYKSGVIISEWAMNIKLSSKLRTLDNYFFDNYFGRFCDFIMPISEYLLKECSKFKKTMYKTPILATFPVSIKPRYGANNFLMCCTMSYRENIDIVLESFKQFVDQTGLEHYILRLVLSGNQSEINTLKEQVSNWKKYKVEIFNHIPYDELLQLYNNANGLLIPLRDSIQDRARFSQKIAEYISTGRPIISNPVGDVALYFKNNESAYLANNYSTEAFSKIMADIALYPDKAEKIGKNGYLIGRTYFDNLRFGIGLAKFLRNL